MNSLYESMIASLIKQADQGAAATAADG